MESDRKRKRMSMPTSPPHNSDPNPTFNNGPTPAAGHMNVSNTSTPNKLRTSGGLQAPPHTVPKPMSNGGQTTAVGSKLVSSTFQSGKPTPSGGNPGPNGSGQGAVMSPGNSSIVPIRDGDDNFSPTPVGDVNGSNPPAQHPPKSMLAIAGDCTVF